MSDENRTLKAKQKEGEDEGLVTARLILKPSIRAADTFQHYSKAYGDMDLMSIANAFGEQIEDMKNDNSSRPEDMLLVQAHTLDAISNNLASRAINAGYVSQLEQYLKLALKAQNQSRATLEALDRIKNPKQVQIVGQANIANGPQQVNNQVSGDGEGGPSVKAYSPAKGVGENQQKNKKLKNKLLDSDDEQERMVPGTPEKTSGNDQKMETLEPVNGSSV